MRHLTQQLLTLSRSDPSSAAHAAHGTVSTWRSSYAPSSSGGPTWPSSATSTLATTARKAVSFVSGEHRLMAELLGNLVDNAIQYGGAGGKITVGVTRNRAMLFVEDEGPGISPSERERVFEPFYRTRDSVAGGCGLGLDHRARDRRASRCVAQDRRSAARPRNADRGRLPDDTRTQPTVSRAVRRGPSGGGRQGDHRRRKVATIRNVGGTLGRVVDIARSASRARLAC